jgi:hypothetical protein
LPQIIADLVSILAAYHTNAMWKVVAFGTDKNFDKIRTLQVLALFDILTELYDECA